ncbi:MAG TPA: HAD family hydrolase [Marmoricola sp.]|nr:HAD family hydrolase [Marmoricola sp.]
MSESWRPSLVALDVDGTLLAWATGRGGTIEHLTDAVRSAVVDASVEATIVLASGRSIHAMVPVLDALGLGTPDDPVWAVAANGAVVFRYPPVEVVHEETFDARPAVAAILAKHPDVMVAVEERGVGYRLNQVFPAGELDGEMIIADTDSLIAEPVSRVIIRDPDASVEDFVTLAEGLGLHGTNYVVGWTAWLDLSPVGVDKASGLEVVARLLGVDRVDVLAIGDGRNDKEMLAWAGRGVAMGQAVDEVRDAADAVTGTVDEDGVATELRRYFS